MTFIDYARHVAHERGVFDRTDEQLDDLLWGRTPFPFTSYQQLRQPLIDALDSLAGSP